MVWERAEEGWEGWEEWEGWKEEGERPQVLVQVALQAKEYSRS